MSSRTLHLVFTLTRGNFIAYLICISFHKAKENEKTNKKPSFISVYATNSDLNFSAFYNHVFEILLNIYCVGNKKCPVYFHSFIHWLQFFSFAFFVTLHRCGRMFRGYQCVRWCVTFVVYALYFFFFWKRQKPLLLSSLAMG